MFFHFVYKNLFKCNFYFSKHLGHVRVLGVEIRKYSLSVTKIQGNLILKLDIRSEVGVGVINCLASSPKARKLKQLKKLTFWIVKSQTRFRF